MNLAELLQELPPHAELQDLWLVFPQELWARVQTIVADVMPPNVGYTGLTSATQPGQVCAASDVLRDAVDPKGWLHPVWRRLDPASFALVEVITTEQRAARGFGEEP